MFTLEKLPLLLMLCVGCASRSTVTTASEGSHAQERSTILRHSKYVPLEKIFRKISKLDGVGPPESDDEEIVPIYRVGSPKAHHHQLHAFEHTTESFRKVDEEDDEDFFGDFEFDDDEEPKHHQHNVSDPNKIMVPVDTPSQEETDMELYDNQSDSSPDGSKSVKWIYFGTKEQLERTKTSIKLKQNEMREAVRHTLRMATEGACKLPQARIVAIQNVYPNPSKTYVPQCTFLHRCGDDTGCCNSESSTCVPKSTEVVELFFYTMTVGHNGRNVEKLSFINHTECECTLRKSDYMVKDETLPMLRFGPTFHTVRNLPEVETEAPAPLKRCQCPLEFFVQIMNNGDCECDCIKRQRSCMIFKKGREYFSYNDRKCITEKQCELPNCEFGEYLEKVGRCPRRNEKIKN